MKYRKFGKLGIELLLVELIFLYITFDAVLGIFERLKTSLPCTVSQQITRRLQQRGLRNNMKSCCKVFHK